MIRTIRMLISAAVIISVLSSGGWPSGLEPNNSGTSTQALTTQTTTKAVPQLTSAGPSTSIFGSSPDDNDPSTIAEEEPFGHEDEEEITYVLNRNTKKFHYPYCRSVKQMKPSNKKVMTAFRQRIIDMGYDPCQICDP